MNNITNPSFFMGVVEDRFDPLMLGRVRVRILGLHTHDKALLPTEDLPWAYKIQQTTSGAISGIGHAPVGVMEGTWVAVQFIDPEKQMPFVVGTLGGIPQSKNPPLESFELLNAQSNVVTSGDGTPVTSGDGTPVTTGEAAQVSDPQWKVKVTKRLGELESGGKYNTVNTLGYLGKYQFGAPALTDRGYVKKGTTNKQLGDSSVWTGKDGIRSKNDFLYNEAIQEKVMSENIDANYKTLKRISVPMDTLDDAQKAGLIAAAHLYGAGGAKQFYNGVVKKDAYGTGTDKYYREGYKSVAGVYPATTAIKPSETATPEEVSKNNEAAIKNTSPAEDSLQATTDGAEYNIRYVEFSNPNIGFKDPRQVYPLKTHTQEPDTNRLARHQKIGLTSVFNKEQSRHTGVQRANGKGSWDQSPNPYNAQYPFNNVWQSESGHVMEFDDTKGRERINIYHARGTYTEIDHNGTQVNFIVGDGFVIMERNGYVHVTGNLDVAVDGAHTLKVDNTLDIQVNGNVNINCHSDANINVANNANMTAGGNFLIKAGGTFAVDANQIHLNSGIAAGLSPIESIGGSDSSPGPLTVNVRGEEVAVEYEVTEDDPQAVAAYRNKLIADGLATEEDLSKPPQVEDQTKPAENNLQPVSLECGIPDTQKDFTGNEQLSKYYKLGDLNNRNSRKLKATQGYSEAQIFCNLKALAVNCLDVLKAKYPNMTINSGYRNFVPSGGSTKSQHMTGQAVDVSFPGLSRSELYDRVLEIQQLIPYDQLLLEYANGPGWIHISFNINGNRKQHFTMNHHQRVGNIGTFTKIA